jgi:hypothetical protein
MRRGAVVEVDYAVGEGFGGEEFEADGAMARLNQGNAFADEDGDYVDPELVDFAVVQKGGDDFAAAHHPDLFAGLGAQALGEFFDRQETKTAKAIISRSWKTA